MNQPRRGPAADPPVPNRAPLGQTPPAADPNKSTVFMNGRGPVEVEAVDRRPEVNYGEKPKFDLVGGMKVDRYRLIERLGGGGMGDVWAAAEEGVPGKRALKFVPPGPGVPKDASKLAKHDDPRIVAYIAWGSGEDRSGRPLQWIAFEHVDAQGHLTHDAVRPDARTGAVESNLLVVMTELADVLRVIHGKDDGHRDIKPENVLRTPGNGIRVIDFGISQGPNDQEPTSRAHTPRYVAPEVVTGTRAGSKAVDIWAFGLLLGEVFKPDHDQCIEVDHPHRRAVPLVTPINPACVRPLRRIQRACLVPLPDDRPTAAEVTEELNRLTGDRQPARRWGRRCEQTPGRVRFVFALLALSVILPVAFGIGTLATSAITVLNHAIVLVGQAFSDPDATPTGLVDGRPGLEHVTFVELDVPDSSQIVSTPGHVDAAGNRDLGSLSPFAIRRLALATLIDRLVALGARHIVPDFFIESPLGGAANWVDAELEAAISRATKAGVIIEIPTQAWHLDPTSLENIPQTKKLVATADGHVGTTLRSAGPGLIGCDLLVRRDGPTVRLAKSLGLSAAINFLYRGAGETKSATPPGVRWSGSPDEPLLIVPGQMPGAAGVTVDGQLGEIPISTRRTAGNRERHNGFVPGDQVATLIIPAGNDAVIDASSVDARDLLDPPSEALELRYRQRLPADVIIIGDPNEDFVFGTSRRGMHAHGLVVEAIVSGSIVQLADHLNFSVAGGLSLAILMFVPGLRDRRPRRNRDPIKWMDDLTKVRRPVRIRLAMLLAGVIVIAIFTVVLTGLAFREAHWLLHPAPMIVAGGIAMTFALFRVSSAGLIRRLTRG